MSDRNQLIEEAKRYLSDTSWRLACGEGPERQIILRGGPSKDDEGDDSE